VLDEFAPFWIPELPQILQTARGTNTAFLFSIQSLPSSCCRPWGSRGCASAQTQHDVANPRRGNGALFLAGLGGTSGHTAQSVHGEMEVLRAGKIRGTGRAIDVQATETRALDEHIKNLPKGQMEILMTDDTAELSMSTCTCHSSGVGCPFRACALSSAETVPCNMVGPISALRC